VEHKRSQIGGSLDPRSSRPHSETRLKEKGERKGKKKGPEIKMEIVS
jgi:hypothetical protein